MDIRTTIDSNLYDKIFVTSDTHFNHNQDFIFKRRGFDNVDTMNDSIINKINDVVGTDGILLHLGDFCLNTSLEQYKDILSRLKIKELWMLNGNHNNPHLKYYGANPNDINPIDATQPTITLLGDYFTFSIKNAASKKRYNFICMHFPIQVWDGMVYGSMHLCGHSHGHLSLSRPEDDTCRILDCGWDVHSSPINLSQIVEIMKNKKIVPLYHLT
jgi:calcineurin-like phosphoesterase family protein